MRVSKISLALTLVIMLGAVSGCFDNNTENAELEQSAAKESAIQSLSQDDLSLFVILGRQTNIPGASAYEHSNEDLEKYCGFKAIAHADVFEDKEEFDSLKAKSAYAVAYNKVILPACIEKIESGS